MRKNLFYLACCFVFMWTIGEVFKSPHSENLVQALSMTFGCAIYLGLHSVLWEKIKALFQRFFKINR